MHQLEDVDQDRSDELQSIHQAAHITKHVKACVDRSLVLRHSFIELNLYVEDISALSINLGQNFRRFFVKRDPRVRNRFTKLQTRHVLL